jgi:glutathione synthase/RimK-type ligase-like ATP-grasp enzyme
MKTKKQKKALILFPFIKDRRLNYQNFVDKLNHAAKSEIAIRGSLKDLLFEIKDSQLEITEYLTSQNIKDFGAIYIRRWKTKGQEQTSAVSIAAKKWGIPVINSENTNLQSFGKITELVACAINDLPLPDTIIASPKIVKAMLKNKSWWLPFPLVMKSSIGTLGACNFLVNNTKELKEILKLKPKVEFVYQQFIENEGDYRVLITGNKVGVIIHRSAVNGDHRNNTSLGAKATLQDSKSFSKKFIKDSIKAAHVLGRELAGVDILVDKNSGKHYILEVNKKTMLEDGTFVPEKMAAVSNMFINILK